MRRIVKKVIFAFMMEWKKIQAKKATNKDITTAKKIFFRIFLWMLSFFMFFLLEYMYIQIGQKVNGYSCNCHSKIESSASLQK